MKSKLMQLLLQNRGAAKAIAPNERMVQAEGSKEATIYIYDPIVSDQWEADYFGGICPQNLVPELAALDADVINLRINSPGGDVFAAQAICTALKQHHAKVIAHIDGIAASAATSIACACDEVVMADGAMYMIHNAWTHAMGDRNDFIQTANLLEKIDGTLAAAYAKRTGMTVEDVSAAMDKETWYTSDEAVAAGFADSKAATKAKAQAWNLAAFANTPKALAAPPPHEPPAEAKQEPKQEPATAGFFMSSANENKLRLTLI